MRKQRDKKKYLRNQSRKHRRFHLTLKRAFLRKKFLIILDGLDSNQRQMIIYEKTHLPIKVPKLFSFIENPEEVSLFISRLSLLYDKREKVLIKMKEVERINYCAIGVLLSILLQFKKRGISIMGDLPKSEKVRKKLKNSGFFKELSNTTDQKHKRTFQVGNEEGHQTIGYKRVQSKIAGRIVEEASYTAFLSTEPCKGVYRVLIELMQNTTNHADPKQEGGKHWWLSVNHNSKEEKVVFVFLDYGVGILESLKKKSFTEQFYESIGKLFRENLSNHERLQKILNGDLFATSTNQSFRGKGLPGIKEALDRNYISNLHVITNNVFGCVDEQKFIELPKSFSGTLVYWELSSLNSLSYRKHQDGRSYN